jgi:hypothetical protein
MSSSLSERLTAAVSALVAIAILGAAVTAQHARTSPLERIASLESDLRYQLELTSRDDHAAYKTRLGEIELTLDAWRKSPQSPDDVQLLIDWLRQAIKSTMPGETSALPALPPFGSQRPLMVAAPSRPPAPVEEPAHAPTPAGPVSDVATAVTVDEAPLAPPPSVDEPPAATTVLHPVSEPAADITDTPPLEEPAQPLPTTESEAAAAEHSITVHPDPVPPAPTVEPSPPVASPVAAVAEPPRVNVNLAELSARIAGYHDGMAEMDAMLVAEDELDGRRLASLVAQAESLAAQYRFVRLYSDALTPRERRFVPAPRSMSETVAMLSQRVAQATDSGDDVLDDFDATRTEEPTLAERLEAVAAAVADPSDSP